MNDAQVIQISLDKAKEQLKDVEAYDALLKNRHFQHLIKKRFLLEEPVRLVHLLQDPAFQTPERQAGLHREMQTIAGFLSWMQTVEQSGDQLRAAVATHERELELVYQESQAE